MSTYDKAWAAHLKRQNILEPNEQTFRHGWNAALQAASELVDCGEVSTMDIAELSVEVYT